MSRLVRVAVPLAVAVLLALAAAAAAFSTLEVGEVERAVLAPPTQAPAPPPADLLPATDLPAPPDEPDSGGISWLGDAVLAVWLAAAVVALVLLVRVLARRHRSRVATPRLRRLRPASATTGAGDDEPAGRAPLLAALDASLADLSDDDRDPRRAVIACWLRLEEAAAAAGVPHHATDTAGDLVVRLLRTHQVSEPVLAGLAEVYRLARYATHTVDERMRTHARSALRRLREELRAAPAAAQAPAPAAAPVPAPTAPQLSAGDHS